MSLAKGQHMTKASLASEWKETIPIVNYGAKSSYYLVHNVFQVLHIRDVFLPGLVPLQTTYFLFQDLGLLCQPHHSPLTVIEQLKQYTEYVNGQK